MKDKLIFKRFKKFYYWKGPYNRLIGGSYWKISNNKVKLEWNINVDIKIILEVEESSEMYKLAEAVNDAKNELGGLGGGAFIINEFKQVIVPSVEGDNRRLIVGEIEGNMRLINPENNRVIDISDDSLLSCGDEWEYPYIGVVYRLSKNNKIYVIKDSEGGNSIVYPEVQDIELINKLRKIRPGWTPVRFIVNPYGIVLTKRKGEISNNDDFYNEIWDPVYVGRINYHKWFYKETFYSVFNIDFDDFLNGEKNYDDDLPF